MSGGGIALGFAIVVIVAVTAYLIGTLIRSIQEEKRTSMKLWKNFGLSLGFCGLFLITWVAHGVTEYQTYTDQQREHNEPIELGDFTAEFAQSTLENWQSEFLQLFSFTIMAAVLIHKGSAESKDSDDRIEEALQRIEKKLGTEPTVHEGASERDLHVLPDEHQAWQLRSGDSTEPEGYYETQEAAIEAGRDLAAKKNVGLHIHTPAGDVRDTVGRGVTPGGTG